MLDKVFCEKSYVRKNLAIIKVWSDLAYLPLEVDVEHGLFAFTRKKWKLNLWKFTFALEILNFLFVVFTMLLTFLDSQYFKIQNVGIHHMKVVAHGVNLLSSYECFIANPGLFISVMNELHSGSLTETKQPLTLQKALLVAQPLLFEAVWFVIALILAADCSRPMILYFAISRGDENCWTEVNWMVYVTLSVFELFMVHRFTVVAICLYIHLHAFERWNNGLDKDLESVRRLVSNGCSLWGKSHVWYMKCRKLQLLLAQFNLVNKFIVFGIKQMFLTTLIVSASAAIARFGDDVPSGLLHAYLVWNALTFFPVVYDKAFCVPVKMELLKRSVLAASAQEDMQLMKRSLASVRVTGVQVGSFNVMERMSTLIYIDFATNSVTSLLLTFRLK